LESQLKGASFSETLFLGGRYPRLVEDVQQVCDFDVDDILKFLASPQGWQTFLAP
jgi:hypothetical protein